MTLQLRKVLEDIPLPMDVPWSKELLAGDFRGALVKIDEKMMEDPSDLAARLWWVQCQAEIGAVPASALNSPLEEIIPQLKEANHLYESAIAAFVRITVRLLDRNQTKLAVVLLERAYDFSKLGRSINDETRDALKDSLVEVIKQERERADLKREAKSYLDALDKKQSELLKVEKKKTSDRAKKKSSDNLSAASLFRDALDKKDTANKQSDRSEFEGDVPKAIVEEGLGIPKHNKSALLITICGVLMIVLGLFSSKIFDAPVDPYAGILAVNLLPSGYPSLQSPSLALAEVRTSGLESVTKRLERLKEVKHEESITWNAEKDSKEIIPPKPKVTPPEVISYEDRKKLPEMNPDKLSTAVVESLGNAPGANPVGNILRGPDGRIY
jgi:hypothetical protein